jgi:hypothetical protein
VRYPNGDGFLTYPGWLIGTQRAISSIRLEQVREGIEDYEYLFLLRQYIEAAKKQDLDITAAERYMAAAEELVTIPNAGGLMSTEIMPNPDALVEMRQRIGEEIVRLRKALLSGSDQRSSCDINDDGKVDFLDFVIVASCLGEWKESVAHPNPDVNGDGVVDISDLIIVGSYLSG